MKIYPYPGALSFECSSGGHGRCFAVCDCWCHHQTIDTVRENYERALSKFFDVAMGADSFEEPHAYHNHDSRFEEPRSLPTDFPEAPLDEPEYSGRAWTPNNNCPFCGRDAVSQCRSEICLKDPSRRRN